MMVHLSLVYFSYRPGGLDMLLNSLLLQNYDDYELIVVDDYPNRDLSSMFKEAEIPVKYWGPSKEKQYKDTSYAQINAINTGILQADGDIVVIIEDYAWLRRGSLKHWEKVYEDAERNTFISAIGNYCSYKPPELISDLTVWKQPFTKDNLMDIHHMDMWIPDPFEYFYCAMPMDTLITLNGMDEQLDYNNQWPCLVWPHVVTQIGIKIHIDRTHIIDLVDHRLWDLGDTKWWYGGRIRTNGVDKNISDIRFSVPAKNGFKLGELKKRG